MVKRLFPDIETAQYYKGKSRLLNIFHVKRNVGVKWEDELRKSTTISDYAFSGSCVTEDKSPVDILVEKAYFKIYSGQEPFSGLSLVTKDLYEAADEVLDLLIFRRVETGV